MAELKKADIKPGDRVMIYDRQHAYSATVVSVARIWCELRRDGCGYAERFRLDDRTNGSRYGGRPRFYTMDEWAKCQREREDARYLSSQAIRLDRFAGTRWTVSALAAAMRAMSDVPGLIELIERYGSECAAGGAGYTFAEPDATLAEIKKRLGVTE